MILEKISDIILSDIVNMKIKCCINGIYSNVIVPIQNKSK